MTRAWILALRSFPGNIAGVAAAEFAMVLPLLVIALAGVYEFGSYVNEAANLDKSLRAGAQLAARSELPLSNTARSRIESIVKRGSLDQNANYLLSGWSENGAQLTITTSNFSVDGRTVPIIQLEATVPYKPFAAGVLSQLGFNDMKLEATQQQAYVGN